jgi:hypothetical protein
VMWVYTYRFSDDAGVSYLATTLVGIWLVAGDRIRGVLWRARPSVVSWGCHRRTREVLVSLVARPCS